MLKMAFNVIFSGYIRPEKKVFPCDDSHIANFCNPSTEEKS